MEGVTLGLALTGCLLVLVLPSAYILAVYLAALVWYPSYLAISIATVEFTVSRIIIIAIFMRLFAMEGGLGSRRLDLLDKIIIGYFVCQILAGATTTHSLTSFLVNRAGAVFDLALPYFAFRALVKNKQVYIVMLKSLVILAAPLAIVGFYQCLTGDNPVGFLKQYHAWKSGITYTPIARKGFYRADVTFSMSIMFGLFFAIAGPVCAGLVKQVERNKWLYVGGLALTGVGVFSSMSSGPMLAALLALMFMAFYRWRGYWRAVVIMIVVMCLCVEVLSNRHFYDVLGGFTLSPATAWYRSRLINVALFEGGMSGHWLTGYGDGVDPGWGPMIDGRGHTDIVNHYLLVLCTYGLLGVAPFIMMNVEVIKRLVSAFRQSTHEADRWLIWCLSASLVGLWGAFVSVSLFGQPFTLYYVLIAFAGGMPALVDTCSSPAALPLARVRFSYQLR